MTLEAWVILGLAALLLAVLIIAPLIDDEPVYDAQEPDDDDGVLVVMGDYVSLNTPGLYQATLTPEQTDAERVRVVPREP